MNLDRPLLRNVPGVSYLAEAPPIYYRAGEVRAIRDADRRRYRYGVIWLVIFQIVVLGPLRIAADTVIDIASRNPKFVDLAIIKPYIVPGMIVLVLLIWILGITTAFKRRGY